MRSHTTTALLVFLSACATDVTLPANGPARACLSAPADCSLVCPPDEGDAAPCRFEHDPDTHPADCIGTRTISYADGSPQSVVPVVCGDLHGTLTQYMRNGGVALQLCYRDGERADFEACPED